MSQMDEVRKGQYTVYFRDEDSYLGKFEVGPFEAQSIREAISQAIEAANEHLHESEQLFGDADVCGVWFAGDKVFLSGWEG